MEKHRHHITPRYYLQGFTIANNSRFVWVYERGRSFKPGKFADRNNPFLTTTKLAGTAIDYYAVRSQSGAINVNILEDQLQKEETKADRALARARNPAALSNAKDKETLADYLCMMIRRLWQHRDDVVASRILSEMVDDQLRRNPRLLSQVPFEFPALSAQEEPMVRAGRFFANKLMTEMRGEMRQTVILSERPLTKLGLMAMRWEMLVAPIGSFFIASDNHVFVHIDRGLASTESELVFPLSSRIALLGTWQLDLPEGFRTASTFEVWEVNKRMARSAAQRLYACSDYQPFSDLLNGSSPPLRPFYSPTTARSPAHILAARHS